MALGCMACEVVRTHIGFRFDDLSSQPAAVQLPDKHFSQEIRCNVECGSFVEGAWEDMRRGGVTHDASVPGTCKVLCGFGRFPARLPLDFPVREQVLVSAPRAS